LFGTKLAEIRRHFNQEEALFQTWILNLLEAPVPKVFREALKLLRVKNERNREICQRRERDF